MLRALKWIGVVLGGILLVLVVAVFALSSSALGKEHEAPAGHEVAVVSDSAMLARGEHLFQVTSACAECHGADAGGSIMADEGPFGPLAAPNLTRGPGSVTASFTPADWERAIRHGLRADGTSLIIMPSETYTYLADRDLAAIVGYLQSLPPVDRQMPRTKLTFLGRALVGFGVMPVLVADITPQVEHVASVTPDSSAGYGRYLADIGGCRACHGPSLAGGLEAGPPGSPPSSNLTPRGIGHYSRADFERALREGKRPDGSPISEAMPWKLYAKMTAEEIAALWAYLQSVPPREYGS